MGAFVTCVMPTRNRRHFVRQSMWYFLRQDYPNKELVIVDDGEDAISDLVPGDERIRYVRLQVAAPLGAKRNLACRLSRGELIAHWDDDDWHDAARLSTQVSRLLASGAELCAPASLLHLDPEKGLAFRRDVAPSSELPRGPLLYRRALWERQPFAETNISEDKPLARSLPRDKVFLDSDDSYYLKILHAGATCPRNLRDPSWRVISISDVMRRLNGDAHYYGRGHAVPGAVANKLSPVTVGAPFAVYDGYGSLSEYVVLSLQRAGAHVNVYPFNLDRRGLSPELLEIIDRSDRRPSAPALCFTWPLGDFSPFYPLHDVVISSMWETSRLPAGWAERINWARAIVVPSSFCAEVFRNSGVTVPVEVVPLGVDPAVYGFFARPERPGITTLTVGTFVPRKNIEVGIAAWKLAFKNDPEARLIIKTRFLETRYFPDDHRISSVDSEETTHGIAHWYREADVLMALGNEGSGLPLVEGMATGLPAVALSTEGQGDVCTHARGLVLDVAAARWERFTQAPFGDCGVRGVPSAEAVADRLRWVAAHREEARLFGTAASDWAIHNRSAWSMGPRLLDVLEQHTNSGRLLRRSASAVVDGKARGTEFGFAASDFAEACGQRLQDRGGGSRSVVLHVAYVPEATDESALAPAVNAARRRGQLVCVTEYGLSPSAAAWEMEASVLLANTQEGVLLLKQRWPAKRVDHLPLGCPAARDAQSEVRDGVALWCDTPEAFASAALPGTVLVQPDAGREELERLLARCSVAALWCRSSELPRASYLARICLASGVAVLTSRAPQFSDLSDVTLQPDSLVDGLDELLRNDTLRASLAESARIFCREWSHGRVAKMATALWQSL